MVNDIKKFCETTTGTNLLTQAEYLADAQRTIGNQPGIARDKLVNKVLRQCSFISSSFADYIAQQTGLDVLDDANSAALLAAITTTFATGLPVGSVINMLTSAVPTGFLKANGAAISRTTYPLLFNALVTQPGFTSVNFTVAIGTPAIFTSVGHGFTGGERLRLTTTGSLPTGVNLLTDYYVSYINANTFNLQSISDVLAGTFVNASGVQGGAHSYQRSLWGLGDGSTTFNVPDFRGAFARAWDDSRGLDPSRVIATLQLDAFKSHTHTQNSHNHTQDSHNHTQNSHTHQLATTYAGANGYVTGANPTFQPGADLTGATTATNNATTATNQAATATNNNTGGTETRPINYAIMPVIKY